MSSYNNIDVILNDYRISELFENVRNTVDVLYEYYMEGFFDIGEYETLVKEAGDGKISKKVADGWAIAKKYLHADVKDIPKMISDAKKQCNMRKLTDEFKIKEILRGGKKIKQIEVEGMKVDIIKSNETLAAATDRDGSAMILLNDRFFDLPLNTQRFTLYHEFAHIKLHSFRDESCTKTIADMETCKGIVRDSIRQNCPTAALSYDKNKDEYNMGNIQKMYEEMINNIEKAIKNGAVVDNNRAKIRKECIDYLNKNPKWKKYMADVDKGKKAYANYQKKFDDAENERVRSILRDRDEDNYNYDAYINYIDDYDDEEELINTKKPKFGKNISNVDKNRKVDRDGVEKSTHKLTGDKNELKNAKREYTKAAKKVASLSHLSPMEVEADRYAANKIGAKNSKKVFSNNKLRAVSIEKNLSDVVNAKGSNGEYVLKEKNRKVLNKVIKPASKAIAVFNPNTESKIRGEIIQDREKDRQKAIKNKKAEAKAKKKEAKKQAKVQESVMESIFSNLDNYYSEGYISESCYNKCVNMFDEWETYTYSWEL